MICFECSHENSLNFAHVDDLATFKNEHTIKKGAPTDPKADGGLSSLPQIGLAYRLSQ